jgi:chorismate-pyruvate lyase
MRELDSLPADSARAQFADSLAMARELAARHFVLQGERPAHVADPDLVAMDPYLRGLLFTDGTVTRTLEVGALSPVAVTVEGQREVALDDEVAGHLEVPGGSTAIERRVTIGLESSPSPLVWAESRILPERLPAGFFEVLGDSRDGIGESLQQVKLESWREMLWFGIDTAPDWGEQSKGQAGDEAVLHRLYRVIAEAKPAILISERFAVERSGRAYRLAA